jgi:hypothetical protein
MMVGAWWAWWVALAMYLAFRLWYDNWRGPLTKVEIDSFMAKAAESKMGDYSDPAVIRAFLEADDGREFIMSNLVGLHVQKVPHPFTGTPTEGLKLLQEYAQLFIKVLFRYGGHPMMAMRKVGGYIDSWNTPPDPGWHVVGAMRYRSRRDMMKLATDPALKEVHPLKAAGTAVTFSFPSEVIVAFALRPRFGVGLVLALVAALTHLVSVIALLKP